MKTRRSAAFTLVELLVAVCLSSVLGLIVYGVASEALVNFARNVSINRSYSNARQSLDRISIALQSAGHVPIMVDATGADIVPAPGVSTNEPGIRFWRYSSSPLYYLTKTPALTDTTLTINLIKPTTTSTVLSPPAVGDMITIAALGFQGQVTAVAASSNTAVLTFANNVLLNTNSMLTAVSLAAAQAGAVASAGGQMSCLDWTSVAFIAVNNQLRYFPKFISGTTNVNTAANYQVLTYLTASLGTATRPPPFSFGPVPSVNVDLYAEAPDYNNRTTIAGTNNTSTGLNTANTYTYLQTALSPRNGAVFRSPY